MSEECYCGVKIEQSNPNAKWNKNSITYTIAQNLSLNGISKSGIIKGLKASWANWTKHIKLTAKYVSNPNADITFFGGYEDGANGTLAWAQLPNGSNRPLKSKIDTSEAWTLALNPGGMIGFIHVMTHEIGHLLGESHIDRSFGTALMNPIYSPSIFEPQTADLTSIWRKYNRRMPDEGSPNPSDGEDTDVGIGLTGTLSWTYTSGKLTGVEVKK